MSDVSAPTAPGTPVISGSTGTALTLTWPAATDNVRVTGYRVYQDGQLYTTTGADLGGFTAQTIPGAIRYGVAYGAGQFASFYNAAICHTSPEGITWTARTMPASTSWLSATFGGGTFVALGANSIAATSPDGITWTSRTGVSTATLWNQVCYGNGVFAAIAYNASTTIAASSSDGGITWTARTLPVQTSWQGLAYGNGMFVATPGSGTSAASSPDGFTWTTRTLPSAGLWRAVAYGNGLFSALTTGGALATSPDGITWTARTSPGAAVWRSMVFVDGLFVAIADGTTAAVSKDGITWNIRSLPFSQNYKSLAAGNGTLVATSDTSGSTKNLTAPVTIGRTTTVTGLTPNAPHTYTITAMDAAGNESAPSAPAMIGTVPPVAPAAPTLTQPTGTTRNVVVTWAPVASATSYEVYRDGSLVGSPAGSPFTDTTISVDGVYTYTVKAVNVGGTSAASTGQPVNHMRPSARNMSLL
jgi:hypothetical protein